MRQRSKSASKLSLQAGQRRRAGTHGRRACFHIGPPLLAASWRCSTRAAGARAGAPACGLWPLWVAGISSHLISLDERVPLGGCDLRHAHAQRGDRRIPIPIPMRAAAAAASGLEQAVQLIGSHSSVLQACTSNAGGRACVESPGDANEAMRQPQRSAPS